MDALRSARLMISPRPPFLSSVIATACLSLTLPSCSVVQSLSTRTEVIHALSDQAELGPPLSGTSRTLGPEITFPRGRYHLTNAQTSRLLKAAPEWKAAAKPIIITGFAASGGLPEYSRMLSQRRAEEVRSVLISAGLEAATLHTVGYGNDMQNQPTGDLVRLYEVP
jgi:outer membrane protein OmpA-like peptidoglycan-associated protein